MVCEGLKIRSSPFIGDLSPFLENLISAICAPNGLNYNKHLKVHQNLDVAIDAFD